MACNARKAAVARMAERATPLTVPAHVLTVGKASIVAKGVAKTPRHMDPIVLSSVLVTGTTLSCKCLLLPPSLLDTIQDFLCKLGIKPFMYVSILELVSTTRSLRL